MRSVIVNARELLARFMDDDDDDDSSDEETNSSEQFRDENDDGSYSHVDTSLSPPPEFEPPTEQAEPPDEPQQQQTTLQAPPPLAHLTQEQPVAEPSPARSPIASSHDSVVDLTASDDAHTSSLSLDGDGEDGDDDDKDDDDDVVVVTGTSTSTAAQRIVLGPSSATTGSRFFGIIVDDDDDDSDDSDDSDQDATDDAVVVHPTSTAAVSTATNSCRKRPRAEPPTPSTNDVVVVETHVVYRPQPTECLICCDACTIAGSHRLVALKCGHLFGRACIEKWILTRKACPNCNVAVRKTDVRPLFSDHVAVVDNAGIAEMTAKFEFEREKRIQVQQELQWIEQQHATELGKQKREVQRLNDALRALQSSSGDSANEMTPSKTKPRWR